MVYDAATGNLVLFGGSGLGVFLGDTWAWNGSTWVKRPVRGPSGREGAAMAYDAATGTVVLFGGFGGPRDHVLGGTWVWNGSTWVKQHPGTSPPARWLASMAYDPATGTVVLFGGENTSAGFGDTWVWNGSTWTQQHPATSPPTEAPVTMAYDPATGNIVLVGGQNGPSDTWVWNGSTWTQQHPATSPPAREGASMAYDQATGNMVLFGGFDPATANALADTWVWNGSTWAQQHPATSPPARWLAPMAYDPATGNMVLFGGDPENGGNPLGDTWVWGSS